MTDKISYKLGELNASVASLMGTFSVVDNKLDQLINSVAVINHKANSAHDRMDEMLEPGGIITQAAEDGANWRENKKGAMWVGGTLAVICGVAGTSIGNAFSAVGKAISSFTGAGS